MKKFISVILVLTIVFSVVGLTNLSVLADDTIMPYRIYITYRSLDGGTNIPTQQVINSYYSSSSFTVSNTIPTRPGYTFQYWGGAAGNNDVTWNSIYRPGVSYSIIGSRWLDAVWKRDYESSQNFEILYMANGGINAPQEQFKVYGQSLKLSSTTPTRTGHTFQGWGTSANTTTVTYQPGQLYTDNQSMTLYAVWEVGSPPAVPSNPIWGTNPNPFDIENGVLKRYSGTDASVKIPNGVTAIDANAFSNRKSLISVTIPGSVTSISKYAFTGCDSLTTICGVTGSFAETYSNERGFAFVSTNIAPNLISANDWAHENINEAYATGLVPSALLSSYTQSTTRAEFCALAVTLYELIKGREIPGRQTFIDTDDVNVQKAAAIGVVNGMGDNSFAPYDTLTREQAATMLSRLADSIGKPLTQASAAFNDNGSISAWAIEAVGQMQATGIMGGVGNNTFAPGNQYTREQSIITILRLYNVLK